ncbi:MAG: tetratricopeptide repeat protein, partial [Planctomycetota bacterium]|nr:tetratricopeptide repeat protein [Planctomycetota bacterium]
MHSLTTCVSVAVLSLAANSLSCGAEDDTAARFRAAQQLLDAGETEKAFVQFAGIPGAQHVAVSLARQNPRDYSRILTDHADRIALPLRRTVQGDLLLRAGFSDPALAAFREVAARISTDKNGWAEGFVPRDTYLAEPTDATYDNYRTQRVEAFSLGPGSHRDNWLIRRFIVLKAWDDTEREFQRVWTIHESKTRPFIVDAPDSLRQVPIGGVTRQIVRPAGFSGQGLQFALDYSFFLMQRKQQDKAFVLLNQALARLDMDRDPNRFEPQPLTDADLGQGYEVRTQRVRSSRHGYNFDGVSRREFIRLTFGAFKQAGLEDSLVQELERLARSGRQQALRILAQVRRHQGLADAALKLELEYITRREFPVFSAAWRRGLAYEAANQPEQAASHYEQALQAPFTPPDLPDKQEETQTNRYASAMFDMAISSRQFSKRDSHVQLLQELSRLYAGLGKSDAAYEATLRALEIDRSSMQSASSLSQLEQRARVLGRREHLLTWLGEQLQKTDNAAIHAEVHWLLKDHAACAKAAAKDRDGFQRFRERFTAAGKPLRHMFLTEIVAAQPANHRAHLELLDVANRFTPEHTIPLFEQLTDPKVSVELAYRTGTLSRTKFWNYYDVVYRLLRMYESVGRTRDLCELGVKIAGDYEAAKTDAELRRQLLRRGSSDNLPDFFNDCMALVIQHADKSTIGRLRELWKDADSPARRQLERRITGQLPHVSPDADVPWANAPTGVRMIVSHDDVHSMTIDDRHVYTGHPWGVVVRGFDGQPVTQIALGQTVHALAAANGWIWAGTTRGLYRIERDTWRVAHIWLHNDVPAEKRYAKAFPGSEDYWFDNKVYSLTPDGDDLWITLHRNVQRLHVPTLTLRAFSYRELKSSGWTGYTEVIPQRDYVWISGGSTLMRYDRKLDSWEQVTFGKRSVRLIGIVDGEVLVEVYLEQSRRSHRPGIVDRDTLEVSVIPVTDRQFLEGHGTLSDFGRDSDG